tara:strand:+ start:120833 stop:121351 length:519 start_codon:yes stop_codon:yes gene_type:complete
MNTKIGIFYGSSTCYTEMVAEQIYDRLGPEKATLHNIIDTPISRCLDYEYLLFGIPTWDYGELQEDWENIWDDISDLDLTGTKAAIFGLGDQVGYPEWFQDAMGYLYHRLKSQGAELTGYWPDRGYEYTESKALTEDKTQFVGLSLDDENQADLTEDRITKWLDAVDFCADS